MDAREVEDIIVGLLAEQSGRDATELRRELEERGEGLPIDSLLAAEVLARVEERLGVSLPATAETAERLKSVTAFAEAVLDLVHGKGSEGVASA